MAMESLKAWLDWWESKGKAISFCYIGNGGTVVTPGTASQVGTSVTVGGSASGNIPGNTSPNPNGGGAGDGQDPLPVTARVVSSVTTTETYGNSSTLNIITTTTTYSNGAKTVAVKSPDGWTCHTTFPDKSEQFVVYDVDSRETTTELKDQHSRATFVNDDRGRLISADIRRTDGTSDRLFRDKDDGHWIQITRGLDSIRTVDFHYEGGNVETRYDNDSKDLERYNQNGDLVYRSHYDASDRSFHSVEHLEHGSTVDIRRTSTTTDNWFSSGSVTEVEEIRTVTHPVGGVTTHRSSTRIESDLSGRTNPPPSGAERAVDWLNDTIKDTWEQFTNDKGGDAPKMGVTEVTIGDEQHRLAMTVGTASNDVIYAAGLVSGGSGADSLKGQADNDILLGGSDHDTLIGGAGADHLDGGTGFDLVSYEHSTRGLKVSLLDPSQNTGEAQGDDYKAVEGIVGSLYADHLMGNAGNNTLIGLLGDDVLMGFNGDDVLRGSLGADVLDGGSGYDQVTYADAMGSVTVNLADASQNTGEAFGDRYTLIEGVIGSTFADIIIGNGLSNKLEGNDGADVLDGGDGENTLLGGLGNDRLYSGAYADVLNGGADFDTVTYSNRLTGVQVYLWDTSKNLGAAKGDVYVNIEVIDGTRFDDVLEGDSDANIFWGDNGSDRMNGGAGADTLSGGDGDDKLEGGSGADRLDGGNGRDTASYYGAVVGVGVYLYNTALNTGDAAGDSYAGIEVIDGSTFNDKLEGNAVANIFWGDAGHDALKGFGGADSLSGGDGEDQLSGGEGADLLDGGAGYDFAVYADATSGVLVDLMNTLRNTGEAYGDAYASIEGLIGSSHADQFYGTAGSDDFHGGGGDDRLEGRGGADQLVGGEGRDHAVYWGASSGVVASLAAGFGTAGDAAGDRFYGIEGLEGSHHADTLTGDGGANTLYGLGGNDLLLGEGDAWTYGNDYIEGGDGADTISGGGGHDWLLGNAGRDVFRFDTRLNTAGVDTLADFSAAEDRIALETGVFGFARVTYDAWGSPVNGTLSASVFKVGTSASTSTQRIIYDQASGAISFDADGVGGQAQVQFAKVAAGTALTASHFQLFTL